MTVKRLMEALANFDENATVYINGWDEYGHLENYEPEVVFDPDGSGNPVIV